MSDGVDFKLLLDVSGKSEGTVTDFCVEHLRQRGYHVVEPNEKWETPGEFNARMKVNHQHLQRCLKRPGCPTVRVHYRTGSEPQRGKTRILSLCSNKAFEAFVLRNKK